MLVLKNIYDHAVLELTPILINSNDANRLFVNKLLHVGFHSKQPTAFHLNSIPYQSIGQKLIPILPKCRTQLDGV